MMGSMSCVVGKRAALDGAKRTRAPDVKLQIPNLKSQGNGSTFKVQSSKLLRGSCLWLLKAVMFSVLASANGAATNSAEDEFKLRPPRGEIAPSFWEQNGKWVAPATIAGALVLVLLVWYFRRPK